MRIAGRQRQSRYYGDCPYIAKVDPRRQAMPAKGDAVYVVIQHLDPGHKSVLAELLAKKTAVPVKSIDGGLAIKRAHVYVIPPNATITLSGERFEVTTRDRGG